MDNYLQTTPQQGAENAPEEGDLVSLIELLGLFLKHWKWFLVGLALALGVAALFLRYATPRYKVTASVVLKDDKSAKTNPMMGALPELAMMGTVNNIENETYVMRSRSLILSVINRLQLHTAYIVELSLIHI